MKTSHSLIKEKITMPKPLEERVRENHMWDILMLVRVACDGTAVIDHGELGKILDSVVALVRTETLEAAQKAVEALPAEYPEYESDDMDRGARMFKKQALDALKVTTAL